MQQAFVTEKEPVAHVGKPFPVRYDFSGVCGEFFFTNMKKYATIHMAQYGVLAVFFAANNVFADQRLHACAGQTKQRNGAAYF